MPFSHTYQTFVFSFTNQSGEPVSVRFENSGPRVSETAAKNWVAIMERHVEKFNAALQPGYPKVTLKVERGEVNGSSNMPPHRIIQECLELGYEKLYSGPVSSSV
jgi:hypothetical protein